MKSLKICLLVFGLLFCGVSAWCKPAKTSLDEIQLTIGGEYKGAVPVLSRSGAVYLHARTVFTLAGAVVSWKEKSKQLLVRNKTASLEFVAGKKTYVLEGQTRSLSASSELYGGMLYLPVDFFTSADFADFCGQEAGYNERAHSLDIGTTVKVGEVDFFSFRDTTRISFELDGAAKYKTEEMNSKHIDILIPEASARSAELVKINDGIVKTVNVTASGGGVKISVVLDNAAGQWKVQHEGGSLLFEASAKGASLDELSKAAEKRKAEDKKAETKKEPIAALEQVGELEEIA
ncbi:MAG TPA: stalk domain-containing protein, partial [Elusimicrobiales bacterium]|nr:stalk domain-containing protein [Elusimicrobiales bacterium]